MNKNSHPYFTGHDLRILGEVSIKLGQLHWQKSKDIGTPENQIAVLVNEVERLNVMLSDILMRQL